MSDTPQEEAENARFDKAERALHKAAEKYGDNPTIETRKALELAALAYQTELRMTTHIQGQ